MMFEAQDDLQMWAFVVRKQAGRPDARLVDLIERIRAYRAERGWNPHGFGGEALCRAESTSQYGWVRRWHCSGSAGHPVLRSAVGYEPGLQHLAYINHREEEGVAWYGPWKDGSYYEAPEGYVPWHESDP